MPGKQDGPGPIILWATQAPPNSPKCAFFYIGAHIWKTVDYFFPFLAPPAERQRSFSNTDLSVVRLSVCLSVRLSVRPSRLRGGRGLSQKRFSNFFFFFGMKLLLGDINHISKDRFGWIALKVHFSRSKRSNLALFAFGGHLLQNCSVTFSLFWHRAAKEGY